MTEKYELDERAQLLLRQLINSYTRDAQPVGSKNLAQMSGLDVSSATIRNIMAKLEDMGLVDSPHTSAGRIPTEAGYRFFIDSLLEVDNLAQSAQQVISQSFSTDKTSSDLIHSATDILSRVTHLAGIVSLTHTAPAEVRHIEFMKLSDRRVLVILVINQDDVHNKVIHVDRDYSELQLQQAAQTLSRYLIGRSFENARKMLLEELSELRTDVNSIMETVLDAMDEVCSLNDHEDLIMSGETNLLEYAELSDINKLRNLFNVFNKKTDLLKLLDGCTSADGVEIFIGSESGYSVLSDCSVVGAPYHVKGEIVGVLGVIGPTRIAYEQVIPVVDVTAKLLTSALNTRK
ncbi:MAG: heat-inducible transcription repressor HrcA [Gammaproteobacteria bacterium]|jgi:heat-inducible transcriptional repressor|nr:heat-inducible transcription repressor HrcA [Gammaproteobacteria bacterium]